MVLNDNHMVWASAAQAEDTSIGGLDMPGLKAEWGHVHDDPKLWRTPGVFERWPWAAL